jgi:hypothetical protein
VRSECLDWTLVRGRRHLDQVVRTYAEHYNRARPHRGLQLMTPEGDELTDHFFEASLGPPKRRPRWTDPRVRGSRLMNRSFGTLHAETPIRVLTNTSVRSGGALLPRLRRGPPVAPAGPCALGGPSSRDRERRAPQPAHGPAPRGEATPAHPDRPTRHGCGEPAPATGAVVVVSGLSADAPSLAPGALVTLHSSSSGRRQLV